MNETSNSKFVTRKWNIVNDQSSENHDVGNKIIYKTGALKFNFYNYNDAYIVVIGNVMVAGNIAARVAFKNCAPFT